MYWVCAGFMLSGMGTECPVFTFCHKIGSFTEVFSFNLRGRKNGQSGIFRGCPSWWVAGLLCTKLSLRTNIHQYPIYTCDWLPMQWKLNIHVAMATIV